MVIIHNEKDGSVELKFSFKEICILFFKKKLIMHAEGLKDFSTIIFTALLKNIKAKKYEKDK